MYSFHCRAVSEFERGILSDEIVMKLSEIEVTEELQLSVLSYYVFGHKKIQNGKLIKIFLSPGLK